MLEKHKKYKKLLEDIENTKEMVKDPDLGEMAKEELKELELEKENLEKIRLKSLINSFSIN